MSPSNKVGSTTPPPYKYSTRKYVDHNLDQIRSKNERNYERLRKDYRSLQKVVDQIVIFLENGPHGSAWKLFQQSGEMLKKQ